MVSFFVLCLASSLLKWAKLKGCVEYRRDRNAIGGERRSRQGRHKVLVVDRGSLTLSQGAPDLGVWREQGQMLSEGHQ